MMARVTIVRGDAPAREFMLDPGRDYRVGRAPECDICIDDAELSRQHAHISPLNGGWQIADLGSKNGVIAGGRKVRQAPLHNGGWFGLGQVMLRFETLTDAQRRHAQTRSAALHQLTMDGRQRIAAAQSPDDVLRRLMDSLLAISSTERAFAMLTQPDGDMEVACSHKMDCTQLGGQSFAGCRGAVREALATRCAVITCDAQTNPELARRASVVAAQTRALVCLPLVVLERTVGLIYADSRMPGKFFTDLDLTLLQELADHAALVVAAGQLGSELDEVDRQLRPGNATVADLRTVQEQIPDLSRRLRGKPVRTLTGVRWSGIANCA